MAHLESMVTLFPRDPAHRLVGEDLAAFFDRLSERIVALGSGAVARVRAGRFEEEVANLNDLLDTIAAARVQARGREDLEVRLRGEPHAPLARFLGSRRVDLKFFAFVEPHVLLDARLCGGCGWPLDYDAIQGEQTCGRPTCGDGEPQPGELHGCWRLRFLGEGPDGIGERFVEEGRRLEGSPFFESLEGVSRTRLFEWHTWS